MEKDNAVRQQGYLSLPIDIEKCIIDAQYGDTNSICIAYVYFIETVLMCDKCDYFDFVCCLKRWPITFITHQYCFNEINLHKADWVCITVLGIYNAPFYVDWQGKINLAVWYNYTLSSSNCQVTALLLNAYIRVELQNLLGLILISFLLVIQ